MSDTYRDSWSEHSLYVAKGFYLIVRVLYFCLFFGVFSFLAFGIGYLGWLNIFIMGPVLILTVNMIAQLGAHFDHQVAYNTMFEILRRRRWNTRYGYFQAIGFVAAAGFGLYQNFDDAGWLSWFMAILSVICGVIMMGVYSYAIGCFDKVLETEQQPQSNSDLERERSLRAALQADNEKLEREILDLERKLDAANAASPLDKEPRSLSRNAALELELHRMIDEKTLNFKEAAHWQEFRAAIEEAVCTDNTRKAFDRLARRARAAVQAHPDVAPAFNAMIDEIKNDKRYIA